MVAGASEQVGVEAWIVVCHMQRGAHWDDSGEEVIGDAQEYVGDAQGIGAFAPVAVKAVCGVGEDVEDRADHMDSEVEVVAGVGVSQLNAD